MIVTSIVPLDKRRSKVFLEEDFAFALYKGEIRRYHLSEGAELEEESYREIMEKILPKRARERVFYLLKNSDKTEQDIRRKLKEGFYPEEVIDRTINFLKEYHYIDDENYGRNYIRGWGGRKSKRQISYALQQKGLSRELINQLLEECPIEEEDQVRKLLKKKKYREDMTREEKNKIATSIGRKGFSFDVIKKMMAEDFEEDSW